MIAANDKSRKAQETSADTIIIYTTNNPNNLSIEQALDSQDPKDDICCIDRYPSGNSYVKTEMITVSNLPAVKHTRLFDSVVDVYIRKSGKIYVIQKKQRRK